MRTNGQVGVGMIGCGVRARGLLQPDPSVKIVALCDPHPDSTRDARLRFNPEARVYDHYEDLVADPEVQWVVISSWNCQHKDHAVAAFRAGKHVFCEKPLATTIEDCLAIRDAWQASGRMFSFGLTLRYSPLYRNVHRLLGSGAIGRIVSFEFNETLHFNHGGYIMGNWRRLRENAGTHILEKCCHDMDLAIWMVGSLPVRVASFGGLDFYRPENSHHIQRLGLDEAGREAYRTWPGVDMVNPFTAKKSIVDNQVVILEYANGVRATFHTNCHAQLCERRFYFLGTEGTLKADALTGVIEWQRIGFNTSPERLDTGLGGGHAGGDKYLWESLRASMLQDVAPLVSIEEGIKSAITAFGIDQALDEGRVVDLCPLWRKAGISYLNDAETRA